MTKLAESVEHGVEILGDTATISLNKLRALFKAIEEKDSEIEYCDVKLLADSGMRLAEEYLCDVEAVYQDVLKDIHNKDVFRTIAEAGNE